MKSSKNNKTNIDEISRETQRLVSESHVYLPYHKPKQKSLKDFLNRPKISSECQVSLRGPKKRLQKAWEFIENKEKNVEKFYNEDGSRNEDNTNLFSDNDYVQDKKTISMDVDDGNNCDEELLNEEKNEIIQSKIGDDKKNNEHNIKSSTNDIVSLFNNDDNDDDDDDDDEDDDDDNDDDDDDDDVDNDDDANKYSSPTSNSWAKKSPTQIITQQNNDNSNISEKHAGCENIVDKNDESTDNMNTQFIENIDDKQNISIPTDESDDEEDFSTKKKSKLITLSESSDDDDDESNTKMKSTSNDFRTLFNDSQSKFSTQQLMNLCSGEFKTQQSENNDQDVDDNFDSEVPIDDLDNSSNEDNIEIEEIPKLISMKDFFDEEAELSESDWSSDDEDNLVNNDKLEEEDGDKDNIDNDIVKDELDKIFRRQLLDDDQGQVNVLKEMLLEDGDLYSDSGRKRKFQWSETDEKDKAFKKPLFSDDDEDDTNDCDTIEEQWRKDRFKRESYLFKKNNCEEQFDKDNVSSDISQTSISVVKKTRIVKFQKEGKKNISDEIKFEEDKNSSTVITVTNDTAEKNKTNSNDFTNTQAADIVTSKLSKTLKGSFMKCANSNMMTTALLYINKKSTITDNDENIKRKFEEKSKKILTTKTAKATNNDPFSYLLRNDKKQEINNVASIDMKDVEKKEHGFSKSFTSAESTQQLHETKSQCPIDSILKQLK